jgi:hypothetical protein
MSRVRVSTKPHRAPARARLPSLHPAREHVPPPTPPPPGRVFLPASRPRTRAFSFLASRPRLDGRWRDPRTRPHQPRHQPRRRVSRPTPNRAPCPRPRPRRQRWWDPRTRPHQPRHQARRQVSRPTPNHAPALALASMPPSCPRLCPLLYPRACHRVGFGRVQQQGEAVPR